MNVCYTMYTPKEETIKKHLSTWKGYEELLRELHFIVVDDCSPKPVVLNPDFPINLTVARITDDIYWNLTGARNLAFHLASNDWCITTDMDHFFEKEQMRKIIYQTKEKGCVYYFKRFRDGKPCRTHLDTFLIHKEDFNKIGGYDEDMAGARGANEDLITAIIDHNKLLRLQSDIEVHNDETHGKVGGYRREMVQTNYVKLRNKKRLMELGRFRPTKNLRFEWETVNEYTIA